MAALFLRLFLIGELNIVAKLIQNLYEGLSQDHHFKWWFENSPKRAAYIAASVGCLRTDAHDLHRLLPLPAHTSYLFAQCRIGTYPPFWALGCSPMQEHIDN